ncbi:MAG: hypothetical protein OEZ58_01665 [Gammaproteobacteria bacterium]|nr:hypothetical protein [Gammaproteobacteria bacterium]MDH5727668.1 hypothetical protein [Gammaproteobacteria bacterium]
MKLSILTFSAFSLAISLSPFAIADDEIKDNFVRYAADATSGSGDTVIAQCGDTYPHAKASLVIESEASGSEIKIKIRHARPQTLYTAWVRLKGSYASHDASGNVNFISFGGSPITNGGATPLAHSKHLAGLLAITPPHAGSPDVANGAWSDAMGTANLKIKLDFSVINGAYPFHKLKNPTLGLFPVAIVNPDGETIKAPFTIRIVSHCQDGLAHGLSPAKRETWFDWQPSL